MGMGNWNNFKYQAYSNSIRNTSRDQLFTRREIDPDLDPARIKVRESVDSSQNPNSTPIVIACDETGSMGELAEIIIKHGLGVIMKAIYDGKPISDPHICCMGVGDAFSDQAPLQVTQFEAEVDPLVKQIANIYIEGNGGSNQGESYPLAWFFSSFKVTADSVLKRGKKGYLFTIGDEAPHPGITREQIKKIFGFDFEGDLKLDVLLETTKKFWNVYHLIVKPVPYQPVLQKWAAVLGNNAVFVEDHNKLAEVIVGIIRQNEGQDATAGFDPGTALVVSKAVSGLTR